jgi:hypothetical protein
MKRLMAAALLAALGGCNAPGDDGTGANRTANQAAPAPPQTVRFVNSRQNALSDNLRRFYIDFSFDYPATWAVTPPRTDGTERNFVRVAAPPIEGYEPFSFHVGFATGSGDAEKDRHDIEQALPRVAEQFGQTLENYRVASVGRARVGTYDSWNWRFSASAPGLDGGRPARLNGRGDIVLPPGANRGVLIISLVTDRTDETPTPAQVGERGTLKAVYDSFRLGAAAPPRN